MAQQEAKRKAQREKMAKKMSALRKDKLLAKIAQL
jgi:hypothetical protein